MLLINNFMELQLGLSLSSHNFESKEMMGFKSWRRNEECLFDKNKRCFQDAFVNNVKETTTLPLLLWSGQPNDDDDDDHEQKKRLTCSLNENDVVVAEEDDQVVGWPPIKSWRKKLLHHHQHQGGRTIIKNRVASAPVTSAGNQINDNIKLGGGSNYKYVKVKMEGIAIARKIDLRLFHSYQTLTNFLISMFDKCEKKDNTTTNYTLTYQHKDGDWLLAGDVPWQTFMESVQRLELFRNGG